MTNPIRPRIAAYSLLTLCLMPLFGCQLLYKKTYDPPVQPLTKTTPNSASRAENGFFDEVPEEGPVIIEMSDLPYIPEEFRAYAPGAGPANANPVMASAQTRASDWTDYATPSPQPQQNSPVVTPAHLLGQMTAQNPQPRPQTREPLARPPIIPAAAALGATVQTPGTMTQHPATPAPARTNQPMARSTPALNVSVSGLQPGRGPVRLAVFSGQESFPDHSAAAKKAVVAVSGNIAQHALADLPNGVVAIAAYQDLNNNGKLDRGTFGIPKEPYGFSNNAKGSMGPPSFKAASVNPARTNSVAIKLSQVRF
ncbi:MAG: DUF2141 domain-containing protein [Planctomycetota bacterium]